MSESEQAVKPRKRSLTSVTLQWLAERMRRSERIKAQVSEGTYQVDSAKVAASIVNEERK
ncbi:MAG: Anti-sigma-28 factor, FlgM [Pseudomonadota bacterium]|jgi:anti-sigma28 factor (negative regulator of flagellin synthesis)